MSSSTPGVPFGLRVTSVVSEINTHMHNGLLSQSVGSIHFQCNIIIPVEYFTFLEKMFLHWCPPTGNWHSTV